MSGHKGLPAVWRDAICESDLDSTANHVALVISTRMNARGFCFPSQPDIAARSKWSVVTVRAATARIEAAGYLEISRSRGRSSHRYLATLPPTANELCRSEWATAKERLANRKADALNGKAALPESAESAESSALARGGLPDGTAAHALPFDECGGCGKRRALVSDLYCKPCAEQRGLFPKAAA